jgi:hypothetical protein
MILRCAAILVLLSLPAAAQELPKGGVIPTAAVAADVARAILVPIYGQESIRQEEPLVAELHGDVWDVHGSFHCPAGNICAGGTVHISIKQTDGRVTRLGYNL